MTWAEVDKQFAWIRAMHGCPQDSVYHAEGDVWTHVRMVFEAMTDLVEPVPSVLFDAVLLHDVAKPVCTRIEGERITSRGHSHRGAIMARRILWEQDRAFAEREQVCALVRYHQSPFHLIDRPDAARLAHLISQTARCDLLTLLARADALGRTCRDQQDLLTRIQLFSEFCIEQDCLTGPRQFPSPLSRFEYFRAPGRDPNYKVHDASRCEVILMSGLPGSGKDTWIRRNAPDLPVVSLDDIREDLGAPPTGNQGAVIQEAKERTRVLLRQGKGFVWNATNLSRDLRGPLIDLFTAYHARTKIVYVEAPHDRLFTQNRERDHPVPPSALHRMMDRWEVPDPTEACAVQYVLQHPHGNPPSCDHPK